MKYLKIEEVTECLLDLSVCLYFSMFYVKCGGRRRRKRPVLWHMEKSCIQLTPERSIGLAVFGSSLGNLQPLPGLNNSKPLLAESLYISVAPYLNLVTLAVPLYWLLIESFFRSISKTLALKEK